mmetsp:Transcript_21843/g.19383  ORF Transcript_21843/g.19383 Transcript_21843/m.19383 type:complete len:117 (-) Transcript_21843:467-817(-)
MMMFQHKIRLSYPKVHKIIFLSSLDTVVKKMRGVGMGLVSLLFIAYFNVLLVVLFFMSVFQTSDLNPNTARNAPPTRILSQETREETHSYVIPFVLSFLLICYWMNKVLLSLIFWS